LKRSNEDLEHFARAASHDLRSPLQNVVQFSQLLERQLADRVGEETTSCLGVIQDSARRMRILIDDLLRYASVSAIGGPTTPVPSEAVLGMALANLQAMIDETGAVVTYDSDLPSVELDETLLLQVFQNLIGNAIHYRSESAPRVHVSAERQGENWLFAVKDNGIGIESQYQERIFEPFKRLHGAERPGSGIGLALSRKIVERGGGIIWVESTPGQGSTFYFTLPA
jgi:light-regulated signal transduction histidine kinase (bacteriophytochrome)